MKSALLVCKKSNQSLLFTIAKKLLKFFGRGGEKLPVLELPPESHIAKAGPRISFLIRFRFTDTSHLKTPEMVANLFKCLDISINLRFIQALHKYPGCTKQFAICNLQIANLPLLLTSEYAYHCSIGFESRINNTKCTCFKVPVSISYVVPFKDCHYIAIPS
jgi:hypothetical protein